MVTKQEVCALLAKGKEIELQQKEMVKSILKQLGATTEDDAVQFDAANGQAPEFLSTNGALDYGTEVYISELWLKDDSLRANYTGVEEGEEEYDLYLEGEDFADYEDILSWLKEKL